MGISDLFKSLTVQSLVALSRADPPAFRPRDWRVDFRTDIGTEVEREVMEV